MNFRYKSENSKITEGGTVLNNVKALERYANKNKYLKGDGWIMVVYEDKNWHKLDLLWRIDGELVYGGLIQTIEGMGRELDDVYQEDMRLAMKYQFDYDFLHSFIKYKQI